MTTRRLAGLAAAAIVVLWGGILVIAAIERRLPDAQQWYGHAAVHVWTVGVALAIALVAFSALRDNQVPSATLRWLVGAIIPTAWIVVIAGALDAVGAYPTLRAFHDRVNAVAAPAGWVLLAELLTLVVVASAADLRARGSSLGSGPHSPPIETPPTGATPEHVQAAREHGDGKRIRRPGRSLTWPDVDDDVRVDRPQHREHPEERADPSPPPRE
jgi:hypothetical protein